MKKSNLWTNADGLVVGFGARDVESTGSSKVSTAGVEQEIVMKIVGTDVADTDVAAQLVNAPTIPAGSHIISATLYVLTAFAGATATVDIGLYKQSDGTAINAAGIDSAIAITAIDADDDEIACDGALIGTVIDLAAKVGVTYNTAALTAGVGTLVVKYQTPL